MIDALYALAVLAACVSIMEARRDLHRVGSAITLVAGVALTSVLIAVGVPFDPQAWITLDSFLIIAIALLQRPFRARDWAIVVLFFPSWVCYFRDEDWASPATSLLVTAQLILACPLRRVAQRAKRAFVATETWSKFDPMRFARSWYAR